MTDVRRTVLEWAQAGRVDDAKLAEILSVAGVLPTARDWRAFLDRLLLWLAGSLLGAGLIFFVAHNWLALGRFAKFGMVEALLVAALGAAWKLGLARNSGKAALTGAAMILGALLALVGQVYQVGADRYELFATWAVLILPWALVGRAPSLWLLWIVLVDLALTLYFLPQRRFLLDAIDAPERALVVLTISNALALTAWEGLALVGVTWLQVRWAARIVAFIGGTAATLLAMRSTWDLWAAGPLAMPVWVAWIAAIGTVYRYVVRDLFMLSGAVLSIILVATSLASKALSHDLDQPGVLLLLALLVLGLSAAGGWWLNRLARERRT